MKKLFTIITILVLSITTSAQTINLDSIFANTLAFKARLDTATYTSSAQTINLDSIFANTLAFKARLDTATYASSAYDPSSVMNKFVARYIDYISYKSGRSPLYLLNRSGIRTGIDKSEAALAEALSQPIETAHAIKPITTVEYEVINEYYTTTNNGKMQQHKVYKKHTFTKTDNMKANHWYVYDNNIKDIHTYTLDALKYFLEHLNYYGITPYSAYWIGPRLDDL